MRTDGTSVLSCDATLEKCSTPTIVLGPASLGAATLSLTFDHGHLYVATANNDILRCSLPDCAGTVLKVVHETTRLYQGNEPLFGHSIAADDEAVYWAAVDGVGPQSADAGGGGEDTSTLVHRIMKLAK